MAQDAVKNEDPMQDPTNEAPNEAPVNPLPPVVIALFLVLLAVEALFSLAEAGMIGGPEAIGWRSDYLMRFGFSGKAFDWMIENNLYPGEHIVRSLSYSFLHGSFYHALFAMVFLLAMGKVVTESLGPITFLVVFFVSAAVGSVMFGLLSDDPWLVGAYPAVYGLIGAFTYLLWLRLGMEGAPQMRAFGLIGMLMMIQLVFSLLFGTGQDWIADLSGFVTGFLLTATLIPGGWARLVGYFRQR